MKRALRGYDRPAVDRLLDRCSATLDGTTPPSPPATREEVARSMFRIRWFGYHQRHVDTLLHRVGAALPEPVPGGRPVAPAVSLPLGRLGYARDEVDAFLWLCGWGLGAAAVEVGLPAPDGIPIRLAPEAVRLAVFRRSYRGYAMRPVDELLDLVEARLRS
ncbi:MAG: DivIVA protein [Frankiales bacterium]|nr:DivIVA protein [Frankiales bacterium]